MRYEREDRQLADMFFYDQSSRMTSTSGPQPRGLDHNTVRPVGQSVKAGRSQAVIPISAEGRFHALRDLSR